MKKFLFAILTGLCCALAALAFTACAPTVNKGEKGYENYLEAYERAAGTREGALAKAQWLALLPDIDKRIDSVEIICGDAVVAYTDGTTQIIENLHVLLAHEWNEGVVLKNSTCSEQGLINYTCNECGSSRGERLALDTSAHTYGKYGNDSTNHWKICSGCGDAQTAVKHSFGGWKFFKEETYKSTPTVVGKIERRVCACGYSKLRAAAFGDYVFKEWSNGSPEKTIECKDAEEAENVGAVFSIKTMNVPVITIDTQNCAEIIDKENYVTCEVSVFNTDSVFCIDGASAGVRLRGNSTMTYPKKPYRIKFDKKQGLFGWEKNKSWVLLALYQDFSNIKDYAAFAVAEAISGENSAFVPHAKHVELYLNGEYKGLYLLCDQVQENSGRVGVEDDFTADDTEVPFLVEMDEYAQYEGKENVDWFKITNADDNNFTTYYNVKYPDAEQRFTQRQFDYVKDYINTVNRLCHDRTTTRAQFEEYIDLNAFIDYYLVQEIMGQGDINRKSVYMSKTKEGKLVMGPIWDFDWAAGGPMSNGGQQAANGGLFSGANWFKHMLGVQWFKTAVTVRAEEIDPIINEKLAELAAYKSEITQVSLRNAAMWDFDKNNTLPDFNEYYDIVLKYIEDRVWLVPLMISYIEAV